MIKIGKPKVNIVDDKAILTCTILIDDIEKELFYEIDKDYKKYLCTERSDAFVIAALYYAMKYNHDIISELPMTSSLHHDIVTILMPSLANNSNRLYEININIPTIDGSLANVGAVGTGISCGIDSFHVLNNYINSEYKEMNLTHLCLNSVGSFKAYAERYHGIGADNARDEIVKRAKKVADEVKLPLIVTNSNVHVIFDEVYYRVHTFANVFSIFLLQKLFKTYYYGSSGYDLTSFDIKDAPTLDSAEYDLLNFYCFQTDNLKIYSEGVAKTRIEKTIAIADNPLAQKYLHVCIKDSTNCGKCLKCRRTLISLEAIGKLDSFKQVFDIDYYNNNKKEYYDWLKKEVKDGHQMNIVTSKLLNQRHGNCSYQDIEIFNKKNLILPENNIETISIMDNEFILNKNSLKKYNTSLYYKLLVCNQLLKLENKKIKIPKYIIDNVRLYYKNQKGIRAKNHYLKTILKKNKTKINTYELIYFLLYKPSTTTNIIKYLKKEGYLINLSRQNKSCTAKDLVKAFKEFTSYEFGLNSLLVDKITIRGKKIVNNSLIKQCKDNYYRSDAYKYSIMIVEKNKYYFLGKTGNYNIAIINGYDKNKKHVYENLLETYGLIKMLENK